MPDDLSRSAVGPSRPASRDNEGDPNPRPGARLSEDDLRFIVETHQRRVVALCHRFLGNREDAEDVAQEVFLEVYRSFEHFRGEAQLSTWIHRIAVFRSMDVLRKRRRKKRWGEVLAFVGLEQVADRLMAPVRADPHEDLEQQERLRAIYDALGSLPDNQRAAIVLSKLDGSSSAEIARILGTTVSAVHSLIHRAKQGIRKRLAAHYDSEKRSDRKVPGKNDV